MAQQNSSRVSERAPADGLRFLTQREIKMIDDLLDSVGEFGEVRLEVKNGRLRFASRTESVDALKYEERK